MFDIYSTHTLLMAVEQVTPVRSFLRDRYFPTNESTDIFSTDDVLVEYKDGKKRLAPFVSPRKGGVTITREGYTTNSYTPPNIAPRRVLTVDELNKKGFGEALYSKLTPEQREGAIIVNDAVELGDLITRREEAMAAETMQNNGCVMRHYADKGDEYEEKEIRFYDEAANPAIYTPTVKWDATGAAIMKDIAAMCRALKRRGLPATDVLCGPEVADVIQNDPDILKKLDIAKLNIGGVDPEELPEGVTKIARLNCSGNLVDVLCYEETYEDENGDVASYIRTGKVIVTAPACGRTVYGAVTQLEQSDGRFHTYAARRVPKYVSDANTNVRTITVTARPLMIPNNKNPWIVADVLTAASGD